MNITRNVSVALLTIIFPIAVNAQYQGEVYQPDTSVQVFANSSEQPFAWCGGFNNPQFATGDLNNDGREDLVVYEKGSYQVRTFINYGVAGVPDYKYRPQYERNFPIVNEYLKLIDYNCDDVPDLIQRGYGGFSLYRGSYNTSNELSFTYYKDLFYSPLSPGGESFETSSFPTPGGAPSGPWRMTGVGWSRQTMGTFPTASPQSGSAMARFNSANLPANSTALLISKRLRVSPNLGYHGSFGFWMYRDNNNPAIGDSVSLYVSHDTTLTNAIHISTVARSRSINQPDTRPADGWYQYNFPLPPSVHGDSLYFIFKGISKGGGNIFIDNVSWVTSNIYGDVNAYVEPSDIPAVADVDGDGDLDFISYSILGAYLGWYKNYRVEEGLPCDSVRVNYKDACWGKVYQAFNREQALGITNCPQPTPAPLKPTQTTHTGNTLCLADIDNDGDYDYFNGSISFSDIQFFQNGKQDYSHPIDTMIYEDSTWQINGHMMQITTWPAAFWVDYDQDGKKDMLFSPHSEGNSENYRCASWYRNTGTGSVPAYTYQNDTFISSKTIDLGTNAYPMFYDYNKDGKPDLFVGGEGYFAGGTNLRARMVYYRNSSSSGNISFTKMDDDFAGMDALNVRGTAPAAGDLDNDGKDDLVVGHSDGTISFYKNAATSNSVQPDWQLDQLILKDENGAAIDSGKYAAPFIYDIDKDGKKDLVIGCQSGYLYFYKNVGAASQLKLQHQTSKLGMAKSDPFNLFSAFSTPFIGKMDNVGKDYILLGSNSGRLYRYTGFQNGNVTAPYPCTDTAYSLFRQPQVFQYIGYRSAPAVADIDGDGKYEMVVGNVTGGIKLYKQAFDVVEENGIDEYLTNDGDCIIYPNPVKDIVYISWGQSFGSANTVAIDIFSISGQRLLSKAANIDDHSTSVNVEQLAAGTYICTVSCGNQRKMQRLIIIK